MLTKEKYLEYLDEGAEFYGEGYRTIRKFVIEYFDPIPYTFEEFHEGMWVWDNNWNTPRQVRYIVKYNKELQFYDTNYREKFEEGLYYPLRYGDKK